MKFRNSKKILSIGLLGVFILFSKNHGNGLQEGFTWSAIKLAIKKQFPTVSQLSTQKLASWLANPDTTKPILLDARTLEEFQVSHLAGAQLANSDQEALKILGKMKHEQPVVVYCSVGYRSSQLATSLQRAGFKNVYNLEGSLFQWANEGRPVYSQDHKVKRVHPYNRLWGQLLKQELRYHHEGNTPEESK